MISRQTPDELLAPLQFLLASRRDSLLLLLLSALILIWTWERGAVAALVGSLLSGGLFFLVLGLVREGEMAYRAMSSAQGWAYHGHPTAWPLFILLVASLPMSLLLAHAAWQRLESAPLAVVLALLAWSWQVWLYFWSSSAVDDATVVEER
jgi:hypothetical protein